MEDIMKMLKASKFWLTFKNVAKLIENETTKQRGGFIGMLLGNLGKRLLENTLAGKSVSEQTM